MYRRPVRTYPNRQYATGEAQTSVPFLPDATYAAALDALVVCCADAAIVHQGQWLIARRAWEPHPDWWVIGGRMRKGELIEQALQRNIRRELRLTLPEERLRTIIGYYSQIWDTRAGEMADQGCHVFSITSLVELTEKEKATIRLNEEYRDAQWVKPMHVIENHEQFHPCLVQIARDILTYLHQ